jgi:tetratricopeptide (TPR) repeat protein
LPNEGKNAERARDFVAEQLARARLLAKEKPEAYLPLVARAIHLLASHFPSTDSEGLYEALAIWRNTAGPNPRANLGRVSLVLGSLGKQLVQRNDWDGAYRAFEEAVSIDRYLTEKSREDSQLSLASNLAKLGTLFADCNRLEEARIVLADALTNYQEIVAEHPEPFLRGLLDTSLKLGDVLAEQGRFDEARATLLPVLSYRPKAVNSPRFYLPPFAEILTRLGRINRQQQRWPESRQALEEALGLFRILISDHSFVHSLGLVEVLIELAQLGFLDGHSTEAQLAAKEATEILSPLAAKNPGRYIRQSELLNTLAKAQADQESSEEVP